MTAAQDAFIADQVRRARDALAAAIKAAQSRADYPPAVLAELLQARAALAHVAAALP